MDPDQQERVGETVDFTNVYKWADAGGISYYVKGTLSFPARVELRKRTDSDGRTVVFDVIAYRQPGSSSSAGHEFVAWGATSPLVEAEVHGRTWIWRSAVDRAETWIPYVEPQR